MKTRIPILVFIFFLLSLTFCGKDNPTSSTPDPNDPNVVVREISSTGGDLTSSDGLLTLTIPSGALANAEKITIEKITTNDLGSEFDQIINDLGVEAAYELGPDGLSFNEPVTVSFQSNQTPVQEDDSIGVFPEFMFTSSNGNVEPLANLQTESDVENSTVTIHGELSHFSPLATSQANNGVAFFVFDVPESLPVGGMFTARAGIYESEAGSLSDLVTILGPAMYEDNSGSPIVPDFSPTSVEMDGNSDDGFTGMYPYTCTAVGIGVYRTELNVRVRFDLDSGPVVATSFAPFITTIECVEPPAVTLNVEKEGNGVVTSEDGQIDCGENCSAEYDQDSETTLTATPADGWIFDRWEGDLTGDANPATVTMDGDKTVTAIFVEEQDVPGLQELVGSWIFQYMISNNTCNDQSGEFEVEANVAIMDEVERQIKIIFGNAPDHPLWGMVKLDGTFLGETDKVDVSGGEGSYFGQEFYDGQFTRGRIKVKRKRPDHGIFFFGTSLFEVTDAEGEHYCKIEYDVEGEKMEE